MSELALRSAADSDRRLTLLPALLLGAAIALSIAPAALVEIPAMVDYPNHLARMSVLARAGTAAANPFYDVAWGLYPNLAMDLIVPPIARLVGAVEATRLFYVASQLLIVGGATALAAAARGPIVPAGVAACLMLYTTPFAWGFVNFEFGLALALWGIAAWIVTADRGFAARAAVHAGFVAALFVSHMFALGIYGFAIGIIELRRSIVERRPPLAWLIVFGTMAAPVVALVALMAAAGSSVGGAGTVWAFEFKLMWLFSLNGFSLDLSMILTAVLALLGYVAFRHSWLRLSSDGLWLAGAFAALYLCMPFILVDTAFVDVRVVVAAALILPAFAIVRSPSHRARSVALAIVACVFAANLGFTAWVQAGYRTEYRALVAAFERITPGSRILVATAVADEDPPRQLTEYPIYHAPTLAVHYADAFVPTLFTYPGKQPLLPKPAVRAIAVPQGGPIEVKMLAGIVAGRPSPETPDFVRNWHRDFDYVCLIRGDGKNPMPDILQPVASSSRFALFRVRTAPPRATSP